ncbi:MAG: hypothetical protein ABF308_16205 [Phaeobacter gallaeciensis]
MVNSSVTAKQLDLLNSEKGFSVQIGRSRSEKVAQESGIITAI